MSKLSVYRPLLSHPQYLKLLIGSCVSRFGDSLDAIALSWIVYEVTHNPSLLALSVAINYLPSILLQPIAGVLTERMNQVRVSAVCNLIRGAVVAGCAVLFFFDMLTAPLLFLFIIVNSTVESFEMPAANALTPKLLPSELYTTGSSLRGGISKTLELLGTAIAGTIIGLFGSHTALFIDAGTFLFCAVMTAWIRYDFSKQASNKWSISGYLSDFKDGFRLIRASTVLPFILLIGAMLNGVFSPIGAFQAAYIGDYLHMDANMLSVLSISMSACMALGSFLVPFLLKTFARRTVLFWSFLLLFPVYLLLTFAPYTTALWPAIMTILAFGWSGVCVGVLSVLFSSIFMETVPKDYMARISGISNALLMCISPFITLICSALVLFLPIPVIFFLCSVLFLLFSLFMHRMKGFSAIK